MAIVRPALEGKIVRQRPLSGRNKLTRLEQDFEGQALTDRLVTQILYVTGVSFSCRHCDGAGLIPDSVQAIAFLVGFVLQSLQVTFGIVAAGTLACCIVC